MKRMNGVLPPVGTLLPGLEPMVVDSGGEAGVTVRLATNTDFMAANTRQPAEVHSVYEHHLIVPRRSPFGPLRVMS